MLCLTNFILLFHYTCQLLKNQGSVQDFFKSCSESQKRKRKNFRSLLKTLLIERLDLSKTSDSSSSFKSPKLRTLTESHWRQDAFPLCRAAFWTFPGSAIALPLALFQICVSCPRAYPLFLALSSRFVSRIYPRLNLSISSKLCLSCAPAASVPATSGWRTPGGQILSVVLCVDASPPSLCPIMFKFLFIILIYQSTLRV